MHNSTAVEVPDIIAKRILVSSFLTISCMVLLFVWCLSTNSMALTAYSYLTIFDLLSMLTCLVTLWVKQQPHSSTYPFGFERFEVLFVFASTVLAQLGAFFIIKESIERIIEQPNVHTGRLLVGTIFALILHLVVIYGVENPAFNHVIDASSSSWLQEHVSDMSESLCHVIPGLSKLLLPRINPFALISFAGALALVVTHFFIDVYSYKSVDTWAAIWIALMTCGTMFPMSVYTGKILLQTTPSHLIGQLDKCLREASTLDGVLEFRHEHFWTVAFRKMVGSVHVRVRRDADEQMVLAHVYHRLSNLISILNVQIFKDDWLRSSYTLHSDFMKQDKSPWLVSTPTQIRNYALPSTMPYYLPSTASANWQFSSPVLPSIENLSDFQSAGGHADQKNMRETAQNK